MNLTPLGDRIICKRLEPGEVKKGGIVIPDTAQEKPMRAQVIEVGLGKKLDDGGRSGFDVAAGDIVLVGRYAGIEVHDGDNEYLVLSEEDILAIVRE